MAVESVKLLKEEEFSEVINIHTIKPLDKKGNSRICKKNKMCCNCEEHQMNGGLGDSIVNYFRELPTPIEMVAVDDSFGESGPPMKLMEKYGLTKNNIVSSVKKVIIRK